MSLLLGVFVGQQTALAQSKELLNSAFNWVDGDGRDQLFPSSVDHQGFGRSESVITPGFGRATSQGANTWLQLNLRWPATKGVVSTQVSKIMILINSATSFRVESSKDGQTWTLAEDVTWDQDKENWVTLTFSPVEADHLRFTNLGTGWFNVRSIRVFGKVSQDAQAGEFASPGNLVTTESIDWLRARLSEGDHPAGVTLERLQALWPAVPFTPNAVPHYFASPREPDVGTREWEKDSNAAYPHALMYALTDNQVYAENVMRILDDWVTKCQSFTGGAASLQAGLNLGSFIMAAGTVRAGYSGWDSAFEKRFVDWIMDRGLTHWMETKTVANGENWTQNSVRSQMALAVFMRNRAQFDRHVELWKRNIATITVPWGETFETARDLEHALMGVAGFVGAAEIAWNQRVDLYSWSSPVGVLHSDGKTYRDSDFTGYRLANVVDYHAQIRNVGQSVSPAPQNPRTRPWDGHLWSHSKIIQGGIGPVNRAGDEHAYNHYRNIKAVELPELKKRIDFTRAHNGMDRFIHSHGLGTITHAARNAK